MNSDDLIRLRHMFDAAVEATSFVVNEPRESLDKDRKLALALVKDIEIIGMRNRLIHAYFDIDLDAVWSTVKNDLPPLISELEKLIPPDSNDS